jgi:GTP-binding protein
MNSYFEEYAPFRGEFPTRFSGSIVADRAGAATAYALFNLEPRGRIFISPGDKVYEGMIIGEHNRENDINVNPTKEKKLTNLRASGKDEHVVLTEKSPVTLEEAIHFIKQDELVEVTPESIRLRKLFLSAHLRHVKQASLKKAASG